MKKPRCIIFAGVNGAGKTTFALEYLSKSSGFSHFINADLIAAGLSPLVPELKQTRASRIYLKQIKEVIKKRQNFAFETTLSGKSYLKLIKKLQINGWQVDLIYLYLSSVRLSVERVAERVKHGGHNIPLNTIKRRYPRSLNNLMNHYLKICDNVVCFDNSSENNSIIFISSFEGVIIKNTTLYQKLIFGTDND